MKIDIANQNNIAFTLLQNVGVKQGIALWAFEWAWDPAEISFRCARSSRICMSNSNLPVCPYER